MTLSNKIKQCMMFCISEMNNAKQERLYYTDGKLCHLFPLAHWDMVIEYNNKQIGQLRELLSVINKNEASKTA